MDLRALEIFRAVAHEGSVSGAAQKLHRVQSNVSTRVKQLEAHLGKALFVRHNRGAIADAGRARVLLAYADRLLQLSTEASEAMKKGVPRGGVSDRHHGKRRSGRGCRRSCRATTRFIRRSGSRSRPTSPAG